MCARTHTQHRSVRLMGRDILSLMKDQVSKQTQIKSSYRPVDYRIIDRVLPIFDSRFLSTQTPQTQDQYLYVKNNLWMMQCNFNLMNTAKERGNKIILDLCKVCTDRKKIVFPLVLVCFVCNTHGNLLMFMLSKSESFK